MYPRQLDQIASQQVESLHAQARRAPRAGGVAAPRRRTIRKHTGWTLIAIGLRLAESGRQAG